MPICAQKPESQALGGVETWAMGPQDWWLMYYFLP